MSFLKSIFKGLQNEPQYDYATATNSHRIHQYFVTETRNRKPNVRGICNRNRNFKTRARILNTVWVFVNTNQHLKNYLKFRFILI